MLEDILKHESLGSASEIELLLQEALDFDEARDFSAVRNYCMSKLYNFGRSFYGAIDLLTATEIIIKDKSKLKLNPDARMTSPLFSDKFFIRLFLLLDSYEVINEMLPSEAFSYDNESNKVFVKQNHIPNKYSNIKKLLLDTAFLEKSQIASNILMIADKHLNFFISYVVPLMNKRRKESSYLITQLKEKQKNQETAGLLAEEFVLEFERKRLIEHTNIELVERVSDNVSLGFDVISFNSIRSLILDRHIEVKSFVDELSFYWSDNEVNTSIEKGDSYFLYLVDRNKIELSDYSPLIIQNPYKNVFSNPNDWLSKPTSWFFELNVPEDS